jgi:hypothetical protein
MTSSEPTGFYTPTYLGDGGFGLLGNRVLSTGLETGSIRIWLCVVLGIVGAALGWYGGKSIDAGSQPEEPRLAVPISIGSGLGVAISAFIIQYMIESSKHRGLAGINY